MPVESRGGLLFSSGEARPVGWTRRGFLQQQRNNEAHGTKNNKNAAMHDTSTAPCDLVAIRLLLPEQSIDRRTRPIARGTAECATSVEWNVAPRLSHLLLVHPCDHAPLCPGPAAFPLDSCATQQWPRSDWAHALVCCRSVFPLQPHTRLRMPAPAPGAPAVPHPHSTPSQVRWHAAEPADELHLDAAEPTDKFAEPVKLHTATQTETTADDIHVPTKDDPAHPPLIAGSRYVYGPKSPLESANLLSMLTVWWVSALVVLGNKRPLQDADVPELPTVDSAPACFSNFTREWEATSANGSAGSLSRALRRAFGFWWWMAAFYCVIANVFLILAPIFVQKIVGVLEDQSVPAWKGYLWSMALVLTTFLSSLFTNQQMFASIRAGNRVRVACVTAIYNKALKLSRASRQLQSTGSTVNIMSSDSSRLFDITLLVHFLWVAPILIIVPLALMISIVGVAAVAGVALLCLLSPLQAYVSRRTGANRRAMLKFADQRVKLMNEILQVVHEPRMQRQHGRELRTGRGEAEKEQHAAHRLHHEHEDTHESGCVVGMCRGFAS